MTFVNSPLAVCAATVLGLVSPGRHVAVLEPAPPQVVDVVRRVGAMVRTVSMRPTEWDFDASEFAHKVGPQTDLIVVANPNPYSGQYLPPGARAAIVSAVENYGCLVLLDESARHSVVEGEDPDAESLPVALGARCIRVDVPAASVLARAASAASIIGVPELIGPIRAEASAFGLDATEIAQSVLARRFADGNAIDDAATLNGLVASGRALLHDGLDEIGVLGLGGPGGWYVPVRAKAIYEGTDDVGEVLAAQAGLAALPLAQLYVEGSEDPYILLAYLRDANVLENCLKRLADFYESLGTENMRLALPAPTDWTADEFSEEAEFEVVDMEPESRADEALPALSDQRTAEINEDLEARTPVEPSVGFGEMPDTTVTNFAEDDARYRAGFSPDNPDPQQAGLDGRREPVVLPFSRGGAGDDRNAPDEAAGNAENVSLFNVSIPDVASPNIALLRPADLAQPADVQSADTRSTNNKDKKKPGGKRAPKSYDDEPFFFDDPAV